VFNLANQQTTILTDDVYTYDLAPRDRQRNAVRSEVRQELHGQPITHNANFGHPLAYQAPISTRLGLRISF